MNFIQKLCYLRWNDYVAIWWLTLICTYLYYIEPPGIYLKYQSTDISMWQPSRLGTWANSWHLDEIRKLLCLPPRYRLLDCRFAHDQSPFGFVGIWLLSRKKSAQNGCWRPSIMVQVIAHINVEALPLSIPVFMTIWLYIYIDTVHI